MAVLVPLHDSTNAQRRSIRRFLMLIDVIVLLAFSVPLLLACCRGRNGVQCTLSVCRL